MKHLQRWKQAVFFMGLVASGVAAGIACSQSNSGFSDPNAAPTTGDPKTPTGDLGNGDSGAPVPSEFNECASRSVTGNASPVHIILAIDMSSSMCQSVNETNADAGALCIGPNTKWNQTKIALKAFFTDPASKNAAASILPWASAFQGCVVQPNALKPADVLLPDTAGTLAMQLESINPLGGTPTHQAIEAAKAYASTLKATIPAGEQIVIALVTDGMPSPECGSSVTIAGNAAQAAGAAGFPVYVIGVGRAFANLDGIAAGAGTNGGKAILLQNNISVEFNTVLQSIKKKSLGCGLQLPQALPGKEIDYKKVNITHTVGGVTKTINHSQDCSDPKGWKYLPNEMMPTSIELCSAFCADVKANDTGTIGVVLGCETKIVPPK